MGSEECSFHAAPTLPTFFCSYLFRLDASEHQPSANQGHPSLVKFTVRVASVFSGVSFFPPVMSWR